MSFVAFTGCMRCGLEWSRDGSHKQVPCAHSFSPEALDAAYARGRADAQAEHGITAYLARQRDWSRETFGPTGRLLGIVDHIRKELLEIEAMPQDVREWVDVAILALDGAWRTGAEPEDIAAELHRKFAENARRTWPDWRTADPDRAIEHVREPVDAQAEHEQQVREDDTTSWLPAEDEAVLASAGLWSTAAMQQQVREAVEREREANAHLAETLAYRCGLEVGAHIRARSAAQGG